MPMINDAKKVANELLDERVKQIAVHGFESGQDDEYQNDELLSAAAAYLIMGTRSTTKEERDAGSKEVWPWPQYPLKASSHRRALVKAGAMIIAAIEKIDREDH